jgi:hypothetical protein
VSKQRADLPKFSGIEAPVIVPPMDDADIYKYDNLFLQADGTFALLLLPLIAAVFFVTANGDGFVDGLEARNYFSKAKISMDTLAKIWYFTQHRYHIICAC